jgi:hypothetical protein
LDENEVGDVRPEVKPSKNNNNTNNNNNNKENTNNKTANNNNNKNMNNNNFNNVNSQNNNAKKGDDFRFKSKNAYMLVYTRRDDKESGKKQNKKAKLKEAKVLNDLETVLPPKLKKDVEEENAITLQLNDEVQNRITSVNDSRKIERDRFAEFLKCADPPINKYCWVTTEWLMSFAQLRPGPINNEVLLCPHNNLRINVVETNNKNSLSNFKNNIPMKRISHDAWNLIHDWYAGGPVLNETHLCDECVSMRSEDKEREKFNMQLFTQMKSEYNACNFNPVHSKKSSHSLCECSFPCEMECIKLERE